MRIFVIVPLMMMMGCGPGLSGTWKGDLDCGTQVPFTATFKVDKAKALVSDATLDLVAEKEGVELQVINIDMIVTQTKPGGDQKLAIKSECSGVELAGKDVGCEPEEGIPYGTAITWTWDGSDAIDLESVDDQLPCDGALKRK